ncbi:MAG: hypothetical protein HDS69_09130 [Bacteroidales bacterium]|nr:hypothetical protein [Bacteroidales bacterium]
MKQTIAISAFAGMLARQSGYTVEFCEHFVIEMFKTVTDALKESDKVTVKGFGTFSVDESGSVAFTPDDTFAADVNAPFDCFEPEVLDDDVTEEILMEEGEDDEPAAEDVAEETEVTAEEPVEAPEEVTETVAEEDPEEKNEVNAEVAPIEELATDDKAEENTVVAVAEEVTVEEDAHDEIIDEPAETEILEETVVESKRRRPVWAFVCGAAVGAMAGAAVTYMIMSTTPAPESAAQEIEEEQIVAQDLGEVSQQPDVDNTTDDVTAASDTLSLTDSATEAGTADTVSRDAQPAKTEAEPQKTEPAPVYDTVKSTLSQLSRKHYGSYEFWVYIYEENRDIISDPNKVETGTRVRIPAPEKYGINSRDKASIRKAKQKAGEISREAAR